MNEILKKIKIKMFRYIYQSVLKSFRKDFLNKVLNVNIRSSYIHLTSHAHLK